ncbi:gliding motility-associated ABC transporter substrate-binding protein GldG [Reichenbachiella versicolor]|uniref:gliding motility-associated ABC transporter substrate-binding protein GldG n=1 Tax=Reichenbachiella versicolor TaxID=1821036 RepID=UPI000D6E07EB|nr:gliding motility-associated ABC transporter substrate-binding protein GldG [Reichenbachiella versicolor]
MVNNKAKSLLELGIGLMVVIIINQLISHFPVRFDMTEGKRYSISEATKNVLTSLQEPVYVDVYLYGDMPAGFKRLRRAIDETLDQFVYYSDKKIVYRFTDPSSAKSAKARNEFYAALVKKGLQPTNLSFKKDGNKTEKIIFPGAVISYLGQQMPVMLLKGNKSSSAEEQLNQSIEGLEYEIANVIRKLSSDRRKTIGMITGHNEPDSLNLAGLTSALLENYNVFKVDLPNRTKTLDIYDALIFPKPTTAFTEVEKFKIDQYIMNGGKALFFIDALRVNMDSASGDGTYAFPYELNLDDMLFKYGIRINRNFVQDIVCSDFPVVAGNMGNNTQIRMLPWPFFPIVNNFGNHPIVKNLDAVSMKFVSTIDTVKASGVSKVPLLMTSQYSLISTTPVKVAFNELQKNLDPKRFNQGSQPVAYLLKGYFKSNYAKRLLPKEVSKSGLIENSKETSILVCADGDMIRNEFSPKDGKPLPLGVSPYNQVQFANQDFVLNAIDYMLNESGVIVSKSKEVQIRPLDKVKVEEEKLFWQVFNLVLPIVLLIVFGVLRVYLRKRKYASFK